MDAVAVGERVLGWVAPLGSEEGAFDEEHGGFHLADRGHETCWLIRFENEQYTLSRMSRGDGWRFHMSSSAADDVERYLVAVFGPRLRSKLLPAAPSVSARRPWNALSGWGPLGEGFSLQPASGGHHLRAPAGPPGIDARVITFAHEDQAIVFSRYAAGTVDDLKRSYLDELGEPLLPARD